MTTGESDVRDLLAKRDNALARGDAAAVVAMMDSDIVSFDLQPPLRLIAPRIGPRSARRARKNDVQELQGRKKLQSRG